MTTRPLTGFLLLVLLVLFSDLPAPAQSAPPRQTVRLDRQRKTAVVDSVARRIARYYLFPDLAVKMAAELRAESAQGAFDTIGDPRAFARALTASLQRLSGDRHTFVGFNPERAAALLGRHGIPDAQAPLPPDLQADLRRRNFGFERFEVLGGNVGYLNLTQFADVSLGAGSAVAAMNMLGGSEAVIIDLRENGGGDGMMVAFLCTYFFDGPPRLINWSLFRDSTQNTQTWTAAYAPGPRMPAVPLYVLTSRQTFSAAEEFAYDLQAMKRAVIVGESTGGGGHHNDFVAVDSSFVLSVSIGQPVNPVTHSNWEGAGVKPDIQVPREQALIAAHTEAVKRLREKTADERQRQRYDWTLEGLTAAAHPVTLDASVLQRYAGTYGERTITFENCSLYYQRAGRPKMRMIPMSESLFRLQDLEYFRLRFDRKPGGGYMLRGLYDDGTED